MTGLAITNNRMAANNAERYNRQLSSVYRYFGRIPEIDAALAKDPDPFEKILLDPIAAQSIYILLHGVAGRGWRIQPGGKSEADAILAQITEDAIAEIFDFPEGLYELTQAVVRARAYSYIEGKRKQLVLGDNLEPQNWWVPTRLKDVDRRRFRFHTIETEGVDEEKHRSVALQMWSVEREKWENLQNPEYFIKLTFQDEESRLGYGRSLIQTLYYYVWIKQEVLKLGLQAISKFANGWITAKVDNMREASTGKTNEAIRNEWNTALSTMKANHVLAYDSKDQIEIIDPSSGNSPLTLEFIRYLDDAMRAYVLGSVLPFGGGSEVGSFAQAKEQGSVHQGSVQFHRVKIENVITRDLVGLFLRLNKPIISKLGLSNAKPPIFEIESERIEDPEQNARVASVALNDGVELDAEEYYSKIGWTKPADGAETIKKEAPQATPFTPGFGG